MRILLTGANGYVGRRLLPELLSQGHEVVCCVRDKNRLGLDKATLEKVTLWEVDFLHPIDLDNIPKQIDVAYYLIHSMTSSISLGLTLLPPTLIISFILPVKYINPS